VAGGELKKLTIGQAFKTQDFEIAAMNDRLPIYSVEKLCSKTTRKLTEYSCSPDAHIRAASLTTEALQDEQSADYYGPFVATVGNWPQNANKIVSLFKTEFFNSIGRLPSVECHNHEGLPLSRSGRSLRRSIGNSDCVRGSSRGTCCACNVRCTPC
jgi:hypothetical protein